jgi:hypothetical protein
MQKLSKLLRINIRSFHTKFACPVFLQGPAMAHSHPGCSAAANTDTPAAEQHAVQWTAEQQHFMQLALHQVIYPVQGFSAAATLACGA